MVNVKQVKLGRNTRMSFSKINEVQKMPNLIEIQKDSYKWFLDEGIKEVFKDISSITDANGKLVLSFVDYRLDENPKYSIEECKERDTTYAAPLRVKAQLRNNETGEVVENEIFMGDFPLMTESGTFVIPAFITALTTIKRVRSYSSQLLSLTEVHGSNMRWTQTTSSMSV